MLRQPRVQGFALIYRTITRPLFKAWKVCFFSVAYNLTHDIQDRAFWSIEGFLASPWALTFHFFLPEHVLLASPCPVRTTALTEKYRQSNIPILDRSAWRNTYLYASNNHATALGGLYAAEGTTNSNLYSMLEVFCCFTDTFELHDDRGWLIERDGQQLQPGNYYIVTNGRFLLSFNHQPLLTQNRFHLCHWRSSADWYNLVAIRSWYCIIL